VCNHLIFGGLLDPEIDKRFIKDYHQKDPWADIRVRKAMNLAIDRKAFCKAIFNDTVAPLGVPIGVPGSEKYQYPYDPAAAKQLLAEAGYPDGFEFELYSWSREGQRSLPLVVEAVQGYWKEIGLKPKLINTEHVTFQRQSILTFKTAGKVYLQRHTVDGDPLLGDAVHYTPEGAYGLWEDATSYNMFKEARAYVDADKRKVGVDKLLQYWHDNYAVVPLFRFPYIYAWDSKKIAPFAHPSNDAPYYLEYVRHAEPLNTFRLFTPWQGR
jgi:peptide/nickel transport system substrate-binding protein